MKLKPSDVQQGGSQVWSFGGVTLGPSGAISPAIATSGLEGYLDEGSSANAFSMGSNGRGDGVTPYWSTAIGVGALGTPSGSYYGNTAIGNNTLAHVTQDVGTPGSGSFNTALGRNAGHSVTTGYSNTTLGDESGTSVTTGINNTYVGRSAGLQAVSGSYNTGVGRSALYQNVSGTGNTALGHGAGYANTTGTNNLYLGYQCGNTGTTANLTNAIAIGAYAAVTQSNSLILGGTGAYAVNVGIGNTAPVATLDITSPTQAAFAAASGAETPLALSNYVAIKILTGASTTSIGTLTLRLKKDAGVTDSSTIGVRLYAYNGADTTMGSMVAYSNNVFGAALGTSVADVTFKLNATVTANTSYWLVLFATATGGSIYTHTVAPSATVPGYSTGSSLSTGRTFTSASAIACTVYSAAPNCLRLTGGPGNTTLLVASPQADAGSFTTTNGVAVYASSIEGTAFSGSSTYGSGIYTGSTYGSGATLYSSWGVGATIQQSGYNLNGTVANSTAVIYRSYNSTTTLTGDLLRIQDASTSTNAGGYLINAGTGSTLTSLFSVDRSGNVAATGKVSAASLRITGSSTPSSATTPGTAGDFVRDSENLYLCVVSGTAGNAVWMKAALTLVA